MCTKLAEVPHLFPPHLPRAAIIKAKLAPRIYKRVSKVFENSHQLHSLRVLGFLIASLASWVVAGRAKAVQVIIKDLAPA